MMSINDRILNIASSNTKLMAFVYDHYKHSVEKDVQKLVEEQSKYDTIKEIEPLLELKNKILEKKCKFVSYNGNMSNYRMYGISNALFENGFDKVYELPSVEHGLIFYNQNWTDTALTARASCVTFGPFRKQILQRYYKTPVFEVGPYIQYADNYYNHMQMVEWKDKLGKTLLVFPMHSTDDSVLNYNNQLYIQEIEKRAKEYDSVIISVFWWNLDDGIVRQFKKMGYHIASAGYREDPNFLRRQRAMIEVADHVISDSVGTHIGYCYKLGKQVEFITVDTHIKINEVTSDKERFNRKQRKIVQDVIEKGNSNEVDNIMNFYWGNNINLTREQLNAIVDINRDITISGNFWKRNYEKVARELLNEYRVKDILKYDLLKKSIDNKGY